MRTAALALLLLVPQEKQDKKPYQPMGAPADPKVDVRWNRYHDHGEIATILRNLEKAFPKSCKLSSLGKSFGDRDMFVMTITNFGVGNELEKAAFWVDGGIHANELQGPEVALYTAWYLLEMNGRSSTISRLLDDRVFYILPMVSPDSRDAHMYEANSTHSPRSGQRPVDDDKDGLVDEDGADDLNGDGSISQMRIKDPNGRWKKHPEFPDMLVPCKPDEKGEYSILGVEGVDNDGDGAVNEDGDGFYDPNRDWAWMWQPSYVQRGAHRYPFSILENRMIADFVMAHPNLAGAQSFHNAGGMILRGPGAKTDRYDGSDVAVYDVIAKKGEQMLPAYRYLDVAFGLYEVWGGELDWFYAMNGILTFSNELWTNVNMFRREPQDADTEFFNRYLLFNEGASPWKEIDHPQFGKVEVGGFRKQWQRQPPSFLLEEECHRNAAFVIYHADQMPQIKVQSVEAKALDGGLMEVTAVITNPKVIPTRLAVDVKNGITRPDLVSIKAKDLKVVAGLVSTDRFFRGAKEQKRKPEELRVDTVPGLGAVYVRWIVKGVGPYTVTARSVKGGVDIVIR
jgi:hypothetical protein